MYQQLVQHRNNLSHAYLLEGPHKHTREALGRFLADDLLISTVANPNIFDKKYTRVGIDEVRELAVLQSKTSVGLDNYKIFIISCESLTREAQNAILKILEEPSPGTIWFLLVTDHAQLLPTVLSRVQLVQSHAADNSLSQEIEKFVQVSYLEREKIYKQFLGDNKKNISPDRSGAAVFIDQLLWWVGAHKSHSPQWKETYRELEQMKDYATDQSSSLKYIFEYIALLLPSYGGSSED